MKNKLIYVLIFNLIVSTSTVLFIFFMACKEYYNWSSLIALCTLSLSTGLNLMLLLQKLKEKKDKQQSNSELQESNPENFKV